MAGANTISKTVGICYTKLNYNGVATCDAFYDGILKCGDIPIKIVEKEVSKIRDCGILVQVCDNSPTDSPTSFRGILRHSGIRRLIIDTGCLNNKRNSPNDLDRYLTVGFDEIKGGGRYYNENSDGFRVQKLGWAPKEWKKNGHYTLVLGQKRFGSSIYEFDINDHLEKIIKKIDGHVVFSQHPLEDKIPNGHFWHTRLSLQENIKDAKCAYGFSTNALVECIYNGVPGITESPRSMAYEVSSRDFNLVYPDRTQWLNNLSYTQWHIDEMKSGECWKHYRNFL